MQKYAFLDRDGTLIKEWGEMNITLPIRQEHKRSRIYGRGRRRTKRTVKAELQFCAGNQSVMPRRPESSEYLWWGYEIFYNELTSTTFIFEYSMVCPHALGDNCDCKNQKIGGLEPFLTEHKGTIDLGELTDVWRPDTDKRFAENLV